VTYDLKQMQADASVDPVWPTEVAVVYLGRSKRWFYYRLKKGNGPKAIRISKGRHGFKRSELNKLLAGGRSAYLSEREVAKALQIKRRRLHTLRAKGITDPYWIHFDGQVLYPASQFTPEQLARLSETD
jgi:predicted DNA-binding transcriptional regulator AlpA